MSNATQVFFLLDTKNGELYGTNSRKGMLQNSAAKKATLYNTLYGTKSRFKVVEVKQHVELAETD